MKKNEYPLLEIRKISLEMTPSQRELEAGNLKASKMRIKKIIEKWKELLWDIDGKNMFKVITSEASKVYKIKT